MKKRILAGGVVLAVTAAAAWMISVPGANAAASVGPELTTYTGTETIGRGVAVGSSAAWYVGYADRGLLTIRDERGLFLGEETSGQRWVAINQGPNGRPLGTYRMETSFTPESLMREYKMQWIEASRLLNRPSGTTSVGQPDVHWNIDVRKVYLTAGDKVNIKAKGNGIGSINFLYGKPGNPASAVRNWASADYKFLIDKLTPDDQFSSFDFVAPATAEYLVVFDQGWTTKEKPTVITTVNGA